MEDALTSPKWTGRRHSIRFVYGLLTCKDWIHHAVRAVCNQRAQLRSDGWSYDSYSTTNAIMGDLLGRTQSQYIDDSIGHTMGEFLDHIASLRLGFKRLRFVGTKLKANVGLGLNKRRGEAKGLPCRPGTLSTWTVGGSM